jgi:carbamoyltransferase
MRYPNSLGLFYSSATRFLGLQPLSDESQVMAAAAYGTPKWSKYIRDNILHYNYKGDYTILQDLQRGVGYGTLDWDIAASVQNVTQTIIANMASWLQQETGMTKLAYAGGVALNCVANTEILKHTNFIDIAIQPAAGDAGCALGAAALLERPMHYTPYLGVNASRGLHANDYASKILKGEIVAVIEGPAEFGPRALGNRSLLCLPTDDNIKKLNKIKNRDEDSWRPYAPICQKEETSDWFHVTKSCPYMLHIAKIKKGPFVTYDNSARLQTVSQHSNLFLWRILEQCKNNGHSILINTSLNGKGKPIVNTVDDLKEIQLYNELCY